MKNAPDFCPRCDGPLAWRNAHPYPLALQVAFALSFVIFLALQERLRPLPAALWGWSVLQIGLGALLIRGRLRARQRVLRCIRCGEPLR